MKNEKENTSQNNEIEISVYKCLSEFRKPLLNAIIRFLNIPVGSNGLDAGCGIGYSTALLAQAVGKKGQVIGLDLSEEIIHYARNNNQNHNLEFTVADVNLLPFQDGTFDWIWSMDTVWPGPKEFGCPATEPAGTMNEFHRVLKPGGLVYLFFWSSQKFLPGYPFLEARLNTTSSATAPFTRGMDPLNHMMNAGSWLHHAGFKNIATRTFAGDVTSPLSQNDQNALNIFFQMLWSASETEADKQDWHDFMNLCDQHCSKHILDNPHYCGFYTYSMFQGNK